LYLGWNSTTHAQSAGMNYQLRDHMCQPAVRGQMVMKGVMVAVVEPDLIAHTKFDDIMKWHVCFLVVCSGCYVLVELYFQWVEVSIKKKMLHKIIADIIFFLN
jgi:hypothetical protein